MDQHRFEVDRNDLSKTRLVETSLADLADDEILCTVDRFALTANNITYGVVGEQIGYWQFFPADDNWGIIPVWGFADVVESQHADINVGERLYGYFPTASHQIIKPSRVRGDRLIDAAEHRAALPPVYNSYARTGAEPHFDTAMEAERMLLFPLYATSYCLYDFLEDNEYFGAGQVIVTSASSKTSIGLGYALQGMSEDRHTVGLTSNPNVDKVTSLGLFDQVLSYDDVGAIDKDAPTVIVDMSGNGTLLSNLHAHLANNMRFTSNVGLTHYRDHEMGPAFIAERSNWFFAPSHIEKRAKDWGPGEFEKKAMAFWHDAAMRSRKWLKLSEFNGFDALQGVYKQLLSGKVSPDKGVIVTMP